MEQVGSPERVVIIGGGIIGGMAAWFLRQQGCQVTIVDREGFGAACSHANCGFVCPSHVLPLAAPGAVRNTLPNLLKRNAPFRIKWRLNPEMWRWFWKFARHCRADIMWETALARYSLLASSAELYRKIIAEEQFDCEWQERGLLFVYLSHHHFESFSKTEAEIRERFGIAATPYDGKQLVELEPALRPGLGGAWHYEGDAHLRPDKLMSQLRQRLEARGVEFLDGWQLERFHVEAGQASSISISPASETNGTATQTLEADAFVTATGAVTPFLNEHLGCRVPIQPGKGYTITMRAPDRAPKIPMILEQHRVGVTPMLSGYRIGSTMEFAGYDATIRPARLKLLRDGASVYLHEPYTEAVEETWYGWRPMTWDGKAIIDQSPRMRNVWIAAGHNMLGLSMGPATGKLVAELLTGCSPHVDPRPFQLERFK